MSVLGNVLRVVRPNLGLQSTDVKAAALWSIAGGTTAIWIVQPFDWLKKTLFEQKTGENAQ